MSQAHLDRIKAKLMSLGLSEYQSAILGCAMLLGESTATDLGKAARVPSPRVYETISELGDMGLVKVRPGRPLVCSPFSAKETVERIVRYRRTTLEQELKVIEDAGASLTKELNQAKPRSDNHPRSSPLVRLVDVGDVSEQETKRMYRRAKEDLEVFSRAFEYLPRVVDELAAAAKRNLKLRVILLDPSRLPARSVKVQREMMALLKSRVPDAQVKFSTDVPLRGTVVDPHSEGAAILLAEEKGVPLFVREAAVTENIGVVRGLALLFDLLWKTLPS